MSPPYCSAVLFQAKLKCWGGEATFNPEAFTVNSPNVQYNEAEIISQYTYQTNRVEGNTVTSLSENFTFKTQRAVPKLGLMLVGWGGNNGSTVTAGIMANQQKMKWQTKEGQAEANYFGSVTQASTVRIGNDSRGEGVYIPFKNLLPMV